MSTLQRAIQVVTEAAEEDKNQNYSEALPLYEKSIHRFLLALTDETLSKSAKEVIRPKCDQYSDRAAKIRAYLGLPELSTRLDSEVTTLVNQLDGAIVIEKADTQWSAVAGLEAAKDTLRTALIMPHKFPHPIAGRRPPWKGILLVGAPGVGKSLLVKAVATEAADYWTFFVVSIDKLIPKWLSCGGKEAVTELLAAIGRHREPSVVFINDISFLTSGSIDGTVDDESGTVARRVGHELLDQLRALVKHNDHVVVLGTTSKPWSANTTIAELFPKRVYIPVPDEDQRLDVIKANIANTANSLTDRDVRCLARKTQGFTRADIQTLVSMALMRAGIIVERATHFKQVTDRANSDPGIMANALWTPCPSDDPLAIEISCDDVLPDQLLEPVISIDDVLFVLSMVKPNVSDSDIERLKKFCE
ncbi:unnamed protein product [Medioppia subpectinata]|uniref:Vesicle-fusing ATPase n=1 Tax=Medioppia subpectinata TaxID=1979941 RepID=A0A7R9PXU3_9ACAR|nr:unnamed protein product [Medioppia subpectinata]CAG2105405.1 unnamed protein product [Medioppia subpectinata]